MAKRFEGKEWDMRVRSITKIDKEKEDSDSTMYKLLARVQAIRLTEIHRISVCQKCVTFLNR